MALDPSSSNSSNLEQVTLKELSNKTSETLGQLAELIEHVQYIGCYVLANIYHRRKLAHEFYDSLIRSVS